MNRFLLPAIFAAGLAAVLWVGYGYLGTNAIALAMTLLIAACYLVGALELRRYRAATASLSAVVDAAAAPPASLAGWLDGLHPSLRHPVRLRVEGERAGLPGPVLTPYLAGLLVLLGMLGTFLGMVVTLHGTGLALEHAADVEAIRASLAAPVKGLGLAFGTSVAGVAASAMLGLLSVLIRRERLEVAQRLDARIATVLKPHTRGHRREASFELMQRQAELLPALVGQLQAMMGAMERQSLALHERLASGQERFHGDASAAYTQLAASVDRTLQQSLADSARAATATIQPVIEATMSGIAREASALHERIERQAAELQSRLGEQATVLHEGLSSRAEALHAGLAERAETLHATIGSENAALRDSIERQAAALRDGVARQAEALHETVAGRTSALVDGIASETSALRDDIAAQARTLNDDLLQRTQVLHDSLIAEATALRDGIADQARTLNGGLAERGAALHEGLSRETAALQAGVAETLQRQLDELSARHAATSEAVAETWRVALADHQRIGGELASQWRGTLDAHVATIGERTAAMSDTIAARLDASAEQAAAQWQATLAEHQRINDRLAGDTRGTLADATASLARQGDALLRTVAEAHDTIDARLAAREAERLSAWTGSFETLAGTLRTEWQAAAAAAANHQQSVCETLDRTAGAIAAHGEAQARGTLAEVAKLVETAAEAPRAAAQVIGELRAKLEDGLARDNAMLDERNRLLETLSTLLDAVNHASTEQRAAIDALVGSSTEVLDRAGSRFAERLDAEAGRLGDAAVQLATGAVEVASLGEAFGEAVQLFGTSNDKLVEQLQRIEGALGKSIARSDEQLAYYVAQAREVIDLSIMSQKQIVEDLQQIASRRAAETSEA